MSFVRTPHALLLAIAVPPALCGFPSCSAEDHHGQAAIATVYEGGTNDEALLAVDAAQAKPDPVGGPAFSTPKSGDKVPTATPLKFTWTATATGSVSPPVYRQTPALRPWAAIRLAHAHGTPVNGRSYVVNFAKGTELLLRVFTTRTEYLPDGAAWEKLKRAGSPITATITTALFDNNRLVQSQSPVSGPSITFALEP